MDNVINRKRGRGSSSTLPEQVLCSSSHTHLLVNLLVDASSPVLKFTALSLGKGVASLTERWKKTLYKQKKMSIE